MKTGPARRTPILAHLLAAAALLAGCLPAPALASAPQGGGQPTPLVQAASVTRPTEEDPLEPFPTRPVYQPGQLVDYKAQTGDTLPVLAARFNTSVAEIREANPIIPASATTMPPGMPMKIPIYYRPFWGSPYQIIPDSLFVNGPAQKDFNTSAFISQYPGWLKSYSEYAGDRNRTGGEIIDNIAMEYSVSPRVLLALSEYMLGALSNPQPPDKENLVLLGRSDAPQMTGFYLQIGWAADMLNNGYYGYRGGSLLELTLSDGKLERIDPWQNSASVALMYYFNLVLPVDGYQRAISKVGLAATYQRLFGDPWTSGTPPHLPGSLEQPAFTLPFDPGKVWAYTGGPHSAWGEEASPLAAIDFAPPTSKHGCGTTDEWATAVANGLIVRTGVGIAVLDLDGDGDERTGWVVFYLHLQTGYIPPVGTRLKAGEHIGHPSCDGGHATGTHIHIARKYNGEWMLADSAVPFNLEGWVVHYGGEPYQGTLTRNGQMIVACTCSDYQTFIQTGRH